MYRNSLRSARKAKTLLFAAAAAAAAMCDGASVSHCANVLWSKGMEMSQQNVMMSCRPAYCTCNLLVSRPEFMDVHCPLAALCVVAVPKIQ